MKENEQVIRQIREYLKTRGISVSVETARRLNVEGMTELSEVVAWHLRAE